MVRLATGQKMVVHLKSHGVPVTALTRNQILKGNGGADLSGLSPAQRDGLVKNTPLWFYVLREAEINHGRLKGVGARIVAETLHRAMEGSTFSIVRAPPGDPASDRTTPPSGWSTCCCSPSKERRTSWHHSARAGADASRPVGTLGPSPDARSAAKKSAAKRSPAKRSAAAT